jgi:YebC/PmpR family DNA-binding regulatory protein
MAGHSKWANIKHRKGAQDKKRSGMFTKVAREIIVAAKSGLPDPNFNPRLRAAIAAAKAVSLPRDRIEYAIKKGSGQLGTGEDYQEMRYEAYGPGGVALIIECLSDNKNRTASDLRAILNKNGGAMGESGSVAFMFDRVGLIQYPAAVTSSDAMLEAAIDAGASDCESDELYHTITTEIEELHAVREKLLAKWGDAESAKLVWQPKNTILVEGEKAETLLDLLDALDDNDDVQNVFGNYELDEATLAKTANEA